MSIFNEAEMRFAVYVKNLKAKESEKQSAKPKETVSTGASNKGE